MTKEITKARIIQEIQDKFALREFEPSPFLFSEIVIPTYNIEKHVQHWESIKVDLNVTSSGAKNLVTVPADETWYIRSYNTVFFSGAYTVAGLYIIRAVASHFIYLDLTAAQSTAYLVNLPIAVVLQPGDKLQVNIDGYTTTGHLHIYADIMKEEIR